MDPVAWLIEPLQYDFVRQALIVGVIVGVLCPVVGCYLVVQRMTLLGNAISHAVLPGLAIAHALGTDLVAGAFVSGVSSAAAMAWIQERASVRIDAAMALILSTFFAAGIAAISVLDSRLDLEAFLFGDLLSVQPRDAIETGVISLVLLAAIVLNYKELLFFTFDPTGAEAAGLPVRWMRLGLISAVTLAIVASMKTVGTILAIALLVGPAITAYLVAKELHWMMAIAAGLGLLSSLGGLYWSYYQNLPSGAAIALFSFGLFLLVWSGRSLSRLWQK
jgi:manganese/iron transport system permease protein